jgi:hypothetical protein
MELTPAIRALHLNGFNQHFQMLHHWEDSAFL